MRAVSKVYAVDGVELSLVRGATITLVAAVRGRTASSGWGVAQLSLHVYVTPPADGIQDCDFLAETPSSGSAVARVLSPILAEHTLDGIDIEGYWGPGRALKGVRVHAVANAKLAMLADAPHMPGARNFSADATDYAPKTRSGRATQRT